MEGEPMKITWYKDNISIDNNPDYQTSKIDNRYILTIEETFVEDSAKFTCRAENDSGISETSAYLSVKGTSITQKYNFLQFSISKKIIFQ